MGSSDGRLPDFIVIGGLKCGTTSFHGYLSRHPDVYMSDPKELDYFLPNRPRTNAGRGLDWYRGKFATDARCCGEVSPRYSVFPNAVPSAEMMSGEHPDARLVYILRHPLQRMVSHWLHWTAIGFERRPFDEIADPEAGNAYVNTSLYSERLREFAAHYDMERILVLTLEDLRADHGATMARVFRFLGVDPDVYSNPAPRVLNRATDARFILPNRRGMRLRRIPLFQPLRKLRPMVPSSLMAGYRKLFTRQVTRPEPTPEQRRALLQRFADDVKQLRDQTGESFERWSFDA